MQHQVYGRIVGNKMLYLIPTASDEDSTVSEKSFPLLELFCHCQCKRVPTASEEVFPLLNKNKEGLGYYVVLPSPTQVYSPPKKDLSWIRLLEFADDTITDYSRHSPAIESTSDDAQNRNPSVTETEASPSTISPKPFIKFMKAADCTEVKTNKVKADRKSSIRYAEMYRRTSKSPNACSKKISSQNSISSSKVSTVCCCCSRQVNTARPKAVINRRNWVNDVKASACWVWKPIKPNSASIILKRYDYVNVRGRSRCSIKFRGGLLGIKCSKSFPQLVMKIPLLVKKIIPTGSDVVPTTGLIFATATVVTPYTRRKGKEKIIKSETPKKKKIQEQMDIQMARQLEEEMEREA
uniref:Uncharacterized protein n=1 Tax=Tanacetum cinerariifolium TaxID=118510 RepID=A0A6L2N4I5_TANCI|nr:hypothetical protein [Tanacetum cinerariifolium]